MNGQRLIIALLFAFCCSGMLTWQLSRHLPHSPAAPVSAPLRKIVIAARPLIAGEKLSEAVLTTTTVPAASVLSGFLSRPQDLNGRVLLVPVLQGEPVLAHDFAQAIVQPSMTGTVPPGMRLVPVPATDQPSAALLSPGNHIDVLVTYRAETGSDAITSLVLQNVEIRSAGADSSVVGPKQTSSESVGLLVTPEQAARLAVATASGKLTFALRNQADVALDAGLNHVMLNDAHERSTQPATEHSLKATGRTSAPNTFVVETLSGGKTSTQTFQESGR